jgi:hypothetical protein
MGRPDIKFGEQILFADSYLGDPGIHAYSLDFIILKTDRKFNNYATLTEIQKKSENDVGLFMYNAKVMVYTYLSCKL